MKNFFTILNKILGKMYLVFAIVVVLCAVLMTLARALTPILTHYKPELTKIASSYIGKPVTIEAIQAGLRGLQPVLDLKSVIVFSKPGGKAVFKIKDLQVGFDILSSLHHHKVIVSRLYLNGMYLALEQQQDQHWTIKGLSLQQVNNGNGMFNFEEVLSWILSQPQLVLENITLKVQAYQKREHEIRDLDLALSNTDTLHQLRGQANLSGHHSPIDLAIDLQGDANDVKHLTGSFYLHAVKTPFVDWLENNQFYGYLCQQGNFSFELWGKWLNNKVDDVQALLNFSHLLFLTSDKKNTVTINRLSANVLFQHSQSGQWNMAVDNIDAEINNHAWPNDQLIINTNKIDAKNFQTKIFARYLNLADLTSASAALEIVPEQLRKDIIQLQPRGEVKNLQADVESQNGKMSYHLQSQFVGLGVNPYNKIPGFDNVDGSINMTNKAGFLQVSSNNAIVNYPQFFENELYLKSFAVSAQWQKIDNDVHLQIFNAALNDADFSLKTNADLLLSADEKKSKISLLASYKLDDLAKIKNYLPGKIMHKEFYNWLSNTFSQSKGSDGALLIKGKLTDFPYVHNEGQYVFNANINDTTFRYAPDWEAMSNFSGHLIFHKKAMHFVTASGNILQQPIKQLVASISDVEAKPEPILSVNTRMQIESLAKAKLYLLNSPMKTSIGKGLQQFKLDGTGELFLKLRIPLEKGETTSDGLLKIYSTNLSFPAWNLAFNHLVGNINFTNDKLTAKHLQALFFNEPTNINIDTFYQNKKRFTQFSLDNILHLQDIKKYFSIDNLDYIQGQTHAKTTVDIDSSGNTHVAIRSDMKGIAIDVPKPFGKPAEKQHDFQVDAYLNDKQPPLIRFNYQSLVGAAIAFNEQNNKTLFQRAIIHFGSGGYLLQKQAGIYINGNLAQFNWDNWQKFKDTFYKKSNDASKNTSTDSLLPDVIKQINVNVKQFNAFKQVLTNLHLQLVRADKNIMLNMESNNVNGELIVPNNYHQAAITGDFNTLKLMPFTETQNITALDFDPSTLFPINFFINQFSYGNKKFGKVKLSLKPIQNGVQISKLSIVNPLYTLDTQGKWVKIKNQDSSTFSGKLQTENLGALLKQEDFTSHLYKGEGVADFSLSWPGKPADFQSKGLQGSVKLDLKDGAVVGLDSSTNQKIGLGKLINILSVQSLFKHLTLNFSDLSESGFSYNVLTGDITLYNGNVFTQNLYLDGSVAEIYIKGDVSLINKLYNVDLKINPYVTSSLPIIATIAGGPIAGIATWAVSKLARAGIEKVVSYQYHIGGTWDKPVIEDMNKKDEQQAPKK